MPRPDADQDIDQLDPEYGRSGGMSVRIRAPIALITNPSLSRVHRVTYPFPTHSCLRNFLRRIYPHSSVDYGITRLHLMKPIQYFSFTTNELERFGKEPFHISDKDRRSQRRNTVLFDADWIVDFFIKEVLPPRPGHSDNLSKHCKQFSVRLRDGHQEQAPYVGLRENVAESEPCERPSARRRLDVVSEDVDPGLMYFDRPVTNSGGHGRQPVDKSYYAPVKMVKGVVEYPEWRDVIRGGMVIG